MDSAIVDAYWGAKQRSMAGHFCMGPGGDEELHLYGGLGIIASIVRLGIWEA